MHKSDFFLSGTMTRSYKPMPKPSPLSPPPIHINSDWYLNIGKPLPSVAAIQSAIRSEPTFIRNFRYRFHLSASTSNKSSDQFRGIAHLTKNNENGLLDERTGDRLRRSIPDYCFVNNNVRYSSWRIFRSAKISTISYMAILKSFDQRKGYSVFADKMQK